MPGISRIEIVILTIDSLQRIRYGVGRIGGQSIHAFRASSRFEPFELSVDVRLVAKDQVLNSKTFGELNFGADKCTLRRVAFRIHDDQCSSRQKKSM